MTFPTCFRCQGDVPAHDDGTLVFCTHCGAAQILLSEELRSEVAERAELAASAETAAAETADPTWPVALRAVLVVSAVAAGVGLAGVALGPVLLLAWVWAVVSPVVVVGMVQAKVPLRAMSAGLGARLGFVTGLGVAAALGAVHAAAMFAQRRMGGMADGDARMTAMIDNLKTQMAAQPGAPLPGFTGMMQAPEFRAGMMLTGFAIMMVILLVVTTAGGAFAGFQRARRQG